MKDILTIFLKDFVSPILANVLNFELRRMAVKPSAATAYAVDTRAFSWAYKDSNSQQTEYRVL